MSITNKIILALLSVIFVLSMSSCSQRLSYFTQSISHENGWTESDLQKIQFYLSDDIELKRFLGVNDSRITKGKIKLEQGREVEQIIFKKGTPGVALFSPKANRLAVSFEEGADNYLIFGPNPKSGGRYTLRGKEWNRNTGKISYQGRVYTTQTRSAFAALLVDLERARKVKVSRKTVGGRKID